MELVRRAADGDEEAFRLLVRRVHPQLRRWALARTADPDDADEVVQRTLIRMHRGLEGFSGRARLSTWLYRILRNAATDLDRSRGSHVTVPEEALDAEPERAETPEPVRGVHARRLVEAVATLTGQLPARQREVLELVDRQGMKAVDAARLLEIEPGTVRAHLFKARRAVRETILERHPELREGYEA